LEGVEKLKKKNGIRLALYNAKFLSLIIFRNSIKKPLSWRFFSSIFF